MRSQKPQLAAHRLYPDNKRQAVSSPTAPEIYQGKLITLPSSLCKPSLRTYFNWDDSRNDDYAKRPILLDLFSGGGGSGMGYYRAGFRVVGVDHKPQPRYPFEFHLADAMTFPLEGYDAIHASPPCQAYCALKTMKNSKQHPDLISPLRKRLARNGKHWVIENVFGAPLINPFMLCGSHFDLISTDGFGLQRHRYFETNFALPLLHYACRHRIKTVGVYGAKARDIAQEKRHYGLPKESRGKPNGVVLPKRVAFEAMRIDWMTIRELSEAIPPAYCHFIGKQLISVLIASGRLPADFSPERKSGTSFSPDQRKDFRLNRDVLVDSAFSECSDQLGSTETGANSHRLSMRPDGKDLHTDG